MMNHAGAMPDHQVRRGIELFAREVYPAIRELGAARAPQPAATAAS
jgi:hypothetical protein